MRHWIASKLAYPIWLLDFLRRHKTIRGVVILHILLFIFAYEFFVIVLNMEARLAFIGAFMIFQFVVLFAWLASGKDIEILPGDPKQITMKDYYGQENLKATVKQWLDLLQSPARLKAMGGEPVRGILLVGEPGTGKSFLAKAIAGEVGVPFIGTDGSSFTSMFMGVGVLKVMRLFGKCRALARQYKSCILFIDEIDAIGSRGGMSNQMGFGGGGMFGGGGIGTLNRILVEMDGLDELTRMMVAENKARHFFRLPPLSPKDFFLLTIGSTNRPDALDRALTRPGRFDKLIVVDNPTAADRRQIINGYLGKVKNYLSEQDIETLVSFTGGFTPAHISRAILTDACRFAIFDNRDGVSRRDIENGLLEQQLGLENPISEWDETQRQQVAYHEAGHALIQHLLFEGEQVIACATIRRRGGALGFMLPVNVEQLYAAPLDHWERQIIVFLAGFAATKVMTGKDWTGATGDYNGVRRFVDLLYHSGKWGTPLSWERDKPTEKKIAAYIRRMEKRAVSLCEENKDALERVAQGLLEHGTLGGKEIVGLIENREV